MSKISKHFEVTVPIYRWEVENLKEVKRMVCALTFCGVAYRDEDGYDYDIDQIFHGGLEIPSEVLAAFGVEPKEDDQVHDAIMAHIPALFSAEYEEEKAVQDDIHPLFEDIYNRFNGIRALTLLLMLMVGM